MLDVINVIGLILAVVMGFGALYYLLRWADFGLPKRRPDRPESPESEFLTRPLRWRDVREEVAKGTTLGDWFFITAGVGVGIGLVLMVTSVILGSLVGLLRETRVVPVVGEFWASAIPLVVMVGLSAWFGWSIVRSFRVREASRDEESE